MPVISVIVPIYNSEKYLNRCIDSILSQTFNDFELLLINDGSTDGSLDICRQYEKKDSRIKVITQENSGSSVARNTGIKFSTGNFIIHFDSDDWVEPVILEKLHSHIIETNADICACGFMFDYGCGNIIEKRFSSNGENHDEIFRLNNLYSSVWNKLVKKSLYEKYDIRFVPGVTMMDDWVVTTRLRFFSKKTVFLNDCLYHYFIAPRSSITTNSTLKYPHSQIKVVEFLENYFKDYQSKDKVVNRVLGGIKLRAKYSILKYESLGGVSAWKKLYRESHRYIISCNEPLKAKIVMLSALILPKSIFSKIAYSK